MLFRGPPALPSTLDDEIAAIEDERTRAVASTLFATLPSRPPSPHSRCPCPLGRTAAAAWDAETKGTPICLPHDVRVAEVDTAGEMLVVVPASTAPACNLCGRTCAVDTALFDLQFEHKVIDAHCTAPGGSSVRVAALQPLRLEEALVRQEPPIGTLAFPQKQDYAGAAVRVERKLYPRARTCKAHRRAGKRLSRSKCALRYGSALRRATYRSRAPEQNSAGPNVTLRHTATRGLELVAAKDMVAGTLVVTWHTLATLDHEAAHVIEEISPVKGTHVLVPETGLCHVVRRLDEGAFLTNAIDSATIANLVLRLAVNGLDIDFVAKSNIKKGDKLRFSYKL